MKVETGIFGRIKQSFVLLINNFMDLFLPIFIYNLLSVVVIGTIIMSVFFSNIGNIMNGTFDIFSFLNNPFVVISIAIGMVLFIVYLLLYIPVLLGLIKSIKQTLEGDKITTIENLLYGFKRLFSSFKTYWYIFAYVALIPALIFILGGAIFNYSYFSGGTKDLQVVGGILMGLGLILFIIFAIYRGIKASFPIYSAVNHDNFNKDDFLNAINITDGNWWRILGNFILMGLIISFVLSIISGLFSFFSYSGIDFTSIENFDDLKNISTNFSVTTQILSGFINNIINTIGAVFMIIFTYLLFIRLKYETNNKSLYRQTEIKKDMNGNIEL